PRNRSRYDDNASRRFETNTRGYGERTRDNGHERKRFNEESPRRRDTQDSSSRRGDRREYGERDRERERQRDRERYISGRDRERPAETERDRGYRNGGPSSRRSASPRSRSSRPHSEQPRSASGSRSPPPIDKAKPNFAPSGLLAAETNTVKAVDGNSTVLKYNEPPEARKPVLGWRLYVFKGSEQVELLHIHRQSAYLIGRDRLVADISVDHPSCSKQHAVIQYRHVQEKDEFGTVKAVTKPFIIDLESTNGTLVNDEAIPVSRYFELKPSDVIKFGQSTREYVLLHDEAT
ncbi:SMAD/FHA domain-containing protein, partial [Collybia nuda]